MSRPWVVFLLTLLLGIQPITTDLYLPAMPAMTQALSAPVSAIQLTLSGLIIAFGTGQLVWGPLADRHGRRPVLLAGLCLYTVASVGSSLAQHVEALVAWRVLQGLAMASAITCARSMVRDLYEPAEGAKVLSRGLSGLGVIALLTPLVGATLAHWVSWRATLMAVTLCGLFVLACVFWRLEETVPRRNREATRLGPLVQNWALILGHAGFRAWTALLMCTYGGLYLFLSASSFVYIEALGLSPLQYSVFLSSNSIAYLLGTFACRRLLARRGLAGAARIGGLFSAVGGLSMAALALAGFASPWTVAIPHAVFAFGHGINQPCGTAGSVGPFPDKAGTAASLSGFLMMVVAFLIGLWLGQSLNGTVMPLALGMGLFGSLCGLVTWTLVRWHGEPAPAAARSGFART
jgi:MFS transporter, DHA1 family, multidrug resistance protein